MRFYLNVFVDGKWLSLVCGIKQKSRLDDKRSVSCSSYVNGRDGHANGHAHDGNGRVHDENDRVRNGHGNERNGRCPIVLRPQRRLV